MHRVQTAKRAEVRVDRHGIYAERIGDLAAARGLDRGAMYEQFCDRAEAYRFTQGCAVEDAEARALADMESGS